MLEAKSLLDVVMNGLFYVLVIIAYVWVTSRALNWFVSKVARLGWRWIRRFDKEQMAIDALSEAYDLDSLSTGEWLKIDTEGGLVITVRRERK